MPDGSVLGPAKQRVMTFLERNSGRPWTIAELHKQTQVSRPTFRSLLQPPAGPGGCRQGQGQRPGRPTGLPG